MKRLFIACIGLSCFLGIPLVAQETDEHRFTANVGAGFTTPVYGTGSRLDTGWNVVGGGGINIVPHVGLRAEFMFTEMGINSSTLSSLQFPGGDTQIWSVTLNPVIKFKAHGPMNFYLLGGPGATGASGFLNNEVGSERRRGRYFQGRPYVEILRGSSLSSDVYETHHV